MHTVIPSFYPDFQCRASRCRHSCCKGWEIDIDEDTAEKYRTMTGPMSEEIRSHIIEENDTTHFVLNSDGNCPMLREDGLCRLILARGEDDLCDICALHPRFFEDCGEYELWGLGLSCEEVCALLLSSSLSFLVDDSLNACSFRELLDLLSVPYTDESMTFLPMASTERCRSLLALMRKTEPIDEQWIPELDSLEKALSELRISQMPEYGQPDRLQKVYSISCIASWNVWIPSPLPSSHPMLGCAPNMFCFLTFSMAKIPSISAAFPSRLSTVRKTPCS